MSDSNNLTLSIYSPNEGVAITVRDSLYNVVGEGVGDVDFDLRPGLYIVEYLFNRALQTEKVVLVPGMDRKSLVAPAFAARRGLSGIAPRIKDELPKTIKRGDLPVPRSDQRALSSLLEQINDHFKHPLGPSAFTLILKHHGEEAPERFLSIHKLDGRRLKTDWKTFQVDDYFAAVVNIVPGIYRMRFQMKTGPKEMILIMPGRDHPWNMCFYLTKGRNNDLQLEKAMLLLSEEYVDLADVESLKLDLTRTALNSLLDRSPLTITDGQKLLSGKFRNPALGLYWILNHFLQGLYRPGFEIKKELCDTVLSNLQRWIPEFPDVKILRYWHFKKHGGSGDSFEHWPSTFKIPPVMYASWQLLQKLVEQEPELIPARSASSIIANWRWGNTPWLLWSVNEYLSSDFASIFRATVREISDISNLPGLERFGHPIWELSDFLSRFYRGALEKSWPNPEPRSRPERNIQDRGALKKSWPHPEPRSRPEQNIQEYLLHKPMRLVMDLIQQHVPQNKEVVGLRRFFGQLMVDQALNEQFNTALYGIMADNRFDPAQWQNHLSPGLIKDEKSRQLLEFCWIDLIRLMERLAGYTLMLDEIARDLSLPPHSVLPILQRLDNKF